MPLKQQKIESIRNKTMSKDLPNNTKTSEIFKSNQKLLKETLDAYLKDPSTFKPYYENMKTSDIWFKKEANL